MFYLDYSIEHWDKLGEMRIFAQSQFEHTLDYDVQEEWIRVYFKTEQEQSFFAMYWADINNRQE